MRNFNRLICIQFSKWILSSYLQLYYFVFLFSIFPE